MRVGVWAWREKQLLVGALVIVAPFVMMLAVIASSGLWNFQNYRYIAPAFPLLMIPVGVRARTAGRAHRVAASRVARRRVGRSSLLFARAARPPLVADMQLFAQGAMDTNTQVVAIGNYIHEQAARRARHVPRRRRDRLLRRRRVYDMLGLVTNHQAGIANNGPGARFEFLESLPPEQRPDALRVLPGLDGHADFYGEVLLHTTLRRGSTGAGSSASGDMQIIVARLGPRRHGRATAQRSRRLDDRRPHRHRRHRERARARLGRHDRPPPLRRSDGAVVVRRARDRSSGLIIDGGRTIRDGGERSRPPRSDEADAHRASAPAASASYGVARDDHRSPFRSALFAGEKKLGSADDRAARAACSPS